MLLTAPRTEYILLTKHLPVLRSQSRLNPPFVRVAPKPEPIFGRSEPRAGAGKGGFRFELDLFRQAKTVFPCYKHEVSSMYKEKYDPKKICIKNTFFQRSI